MNDQDSLNHCLKQLRTTSSIVLLLKYALFWPAGIIVLPTKRHRPEGAHTAPGHLYSQGHQGLNLFRRLNILSLERHQLRGDLISAHNISHGRLDLRRAEFFEAPSERDLRGHDFKLCQRSFRLLRRKAAFSVKLPISWNKLPMEIVNSPTLDTFKQLLVLAWSSLFSSLP